MEQSVLHKFNPAVPRRWLLLLAGLMWTMVGMFLCYRAFGWLEAFRGSFAILLGTSGILVAVAGSRFMLSNAARRNVGRISLLPQRACLFAFTAWKGYAMIGLMITLGVTLRNSSLPKQYLAPFYLAMGGALVLSSIVFYRSFLNHH